MVLHVSNRRRMLRLMYLHEAEKCKRRLICFLMLMQISESQRQWWVHPLNNSRDEKSEFYFLYPDLWHFKDHFFNYYRMTPKQFDEILKEVEPDLRKKWTNMRVPLSPEFKLVVTLT